jgi:small subunit ribosomal protein S21
LKYRYGVCSQILDSDLKKKVAEIIYFFNCFEKTISISNFAPRLKTEILIMIIVPLKEGENIERALKKFKRKFEKTGVIRELRSRQAFIKPSVRRREEIKKAMYVQKMQESEE